MKKVCGTCAYWFYKGYSNEYEDDEGECFRLWAKTKQGEICQEYVIHPALLED